MKHVLKKRMFDMAKTDVRVVINKDSPRAADFMRVFGRRDMPVVADTPVPVVVPDYEKPVLAYRIDLSGITPNQRERLKQHVAGRYAPMLDDEISQLLDDNGLYILADECTVVVQHSLTWID